MQRQGSPIRFKLDPNREDRSHTLRKVKESTPASEPTHREAASAAVLGSYRQTMKGCARVLAQHMKEAADIGEELTPPRPVGQADRIVGVHGSSRLCQSREAACKHDRREAEHTLSEARAARNRLRGGPASLGADINENDTVEGADAATEGLEVVQGNGLAVADAAFKAAKYDLQM